MVKQVGSFLAKVFNTAVRPFQVGAGNRQHLVNPTRVLCPDNIWWSWKALNRWQQLHILYLLAKENPICSASLGLLISLTNTAVVFPGVSPKTTKKLREIFEQIGWEEVCHKMLWNTNTFGFSASEIVLNQNLDGLDRICTPLSLYMRANVDEYGQCWAWTQINGWAWNNQNPLNATIIPSSKIIPLRRNSTSFDDVYSESLFSPSIKLLREIEILSDTILAQANRILKARWCVEIPNDDKPTKEEYIARMQQVMATFESLENEGIESKNLYVPMGCKVTCLETSGSRFTEEMRMCLNAFCASVNIPAGILGLGEITGNGAQQVTRLAQNLLFAQISNTQEQLAASLNRTLMPLIARVYSIDEPIKIAFTPSRIIDEKLIEEVSALHRANIVDEVALGVRDYDYLATELGAIDGPADLDRMKVAIAARMTGGGAGADKPKDTSIQKFSDETASHNNNI